MKDLSLSIANSEVQIATAEQFQTGLKEIYNVDKTLDEINDALSTIDTDTLISNELAKYEAVEIESTDVINNIKLTEHPDQKTRELYQKIFSEGKKVYGIKKDGKLIILQPKTSSGEFITDTNILDEAKNHIIKIVQSNVNFQILQQLK